MMIQAGLNQQDKRIWCKVISTATKLDIIMVRTDRTKPPYTLFFNEDVKYMKHLRSFGEMAVVAIHEGGEMRSKLDTRGKTCMFVGYADDHAGDVQESYFEQRCTMVESILETLQNETQ